MKNGSHTFYLLRRVLGYRLSRAGLMKPPGPINLTLSVTNMCQSRCKTCDIWRLYKENPGQMKSELSVREIERVLAGMGETYFFNISGGEPFLRRDLPQIVAAACEHLNPGVIHTPTNALTPGLIEEKVGEILEIIRSTGKKITFTIKPSFDGVWEAHDEIRGVRGNFEKVLDTIDRLKRLQASYPNLEIGLGTVISRFNLGHIRETARFARELGVDSYISEIAEQRTEMFNVGHPITPAPDEYEKAIAEFSDELDRGPFSERSISSITLAFRRVYYSYATRILRERRQVLPCYAGFSNVHVSPYGDVWPCCILGYAKSMGNLKDHEYNFYKIWHSQEADRVRRYIVEGRCYCPLANQAYSNILCSPAAMIQVLRRRRATTAGERMMQVAER